LIPNASITHSARVTSLDWQPTGRVLAVGWSDGMISCWVVDGKIRPSSTFSNSSQHNSPITVMKWNPFGKRLVTGDSSGLLCVWTVDSRGTLSPSRQYRKKGAITSVAFCKLPVPQRHSDKPSKSNIILKQNQIPPISSVQIKED